MNIAIASIMFLSIWVWILYEMYNAPEVDENGNIVNKDKDDK